MARYVAFLRGVSPVNAKMPALQAAFEAAGFTNVRTLLSSGNVVFDARAAAAAALEQRAEKAMTAALGKAFMTLVRPSADLNALIAAEPFAAFALPANAKRIVTFFKRPLAERPALPIEFEGATILQARADLALACYTPNPKGPLFMALLERTFGKDVTTRTWDTVAKAARA